ncbi:MAG: FKBP-type peptidyl-prolyl cis-trans isomerase [Solirubrobacterales bacterium]
MASGGGGGSDASPEDQTKPKVEVPSGPPPKALQVRDITEGDGTAAQPGDILTMQYVGVDYSTGKEFGSSWESGQPLTAQLAVGQVIPGWDQGLQGMKVGGRRELIVPPNLAYGKQGKPPDIKPNATLVFVVDLLDVQPPPSQ